MASYNTNLKDWGATGSEFPDGYNYLEGEQPVDAWDNFLTYNLVSDVKDHLIPLTNSRIESDYGPSTGHPGTPEHPHAYYDTDNERAQYWDAAKSVWYDHLRRDGDVMDGTLDMGGYALTDGKGRLTVDAAANIQGANLDHAWFSKQEGGTVTAGNSVVLVTAELADGETFYVTQGHLTEDGWNTAVASGVDLIIAADGSGKQATLFAGDGTAVFESTGSPLASYTNTTGAAQQVAVLIDNGEYGTGAGSDVKAYGGAIARVV